MGVLFFWMSIDTVSEKHATKEVVAPEKEVVSGGEGKEDNQTEGTETKKETNHDEIMKKRRERFGGNPPASSNPEPEQSKHLEGNKSLEVDLDELIKTNKAKRKGKRKSSTGTNAAKKQQSEPP